MTRMVRRMWKCKSFEGMVDGRPLAHNGEPSESSVANTRTASRRGDRAACTVVFDTRVWAGARKVLVAATRHTLACK